MNQQAFRELPLETLHDLLFEAVRELLEALDSNDDSGIKARIKRKQVELLHDLINEKKQSVSGKRSKV